MTERFLTAATVDHILKNPCPEAEERGKKKSYYQSYKGAPIPKPNITGKETNSQR